MVSVVGGLVAAKPTQEDFFILLYRHTTWASTHLYMVEYWDGDEDWLQGVKLHKNFADRLPKNIPIFLYQCENVETIT